MGNVSNRIKEFSPEDKLSLQEIVEDLIKRKNEDGSVTIHAEEFKELENLVTQLSSSKATPGNKDVYRESNTEPVRLLLPMESNATIKFMKELQNITNGKRLTVDEFNSFDDENFPRTLIICDMKSRPDSDIESAVVSLDSRFFAKCILIGLHIRDQHDLPTVTTETGSNVSKYNFEDIIDIVFHPDRGIYDCDWNRVAKGKMKTLKAFDGNRKTTEPKQLN